MSGDQNEATWVICRNIKSGRQRDYDDWLERYLTSERKAPGYIHTSQIVTHIRLNKGIVLFFLKPSKYAQSHYDVTHYDYNQEGTLVVAAYTDGWNYGLCTYDEYVEKLTLHDNKNYDDVIKAWQVFYCLV